MEEVDAQVRVTGFDRLMNILDVGDVKGAGLVVFFQLPIVILHV